MCDMSGKPIEITPGVPKDVEGMRKSLIDLISGGVGQGATPYSGPLGSQTDPLQLMAANMLSKKMGYGGYKAPGFYGMQGQPAGSGGMKMKSIAQGGSEGAGGGGFRAALPDTNTYDDNRRSSGGSVRGGYGRDRRDYDSTNPWKPRPRGGANPRRNW